MFLIKILLLALRRITGSSGRPERRASDVTADLGPLREIPHALFRHVFPGLPLPLIMKLSRSSRDCWHAARAAIPIKLDALVASVSRGCKYFSPKQLAVLMQFLERFTGAAPVLRKRSNEGFFVAPDGTVTGRTWHGKPGLSVKLSSLETRDGVGEWTMMFDSNPGGRDSCIIEFKYQWNSVMGTMVRKSIKLSIHSCEGVEDGQALLLLFQRAWQADRLSFHAPFKSPCQCAAIILASRITLWWQLERYVLYIIPGVYSVPCPDQWEFGQEGPHLELAQWPCDRAKRFAVGFESLGPLA
eukprot:jgi/Botrbrau1/11633/Bobra.0209s0023.1